MQFRSDFLDEIRARVAPSQVVGRKVALKKRGREFVGLSPFNKEKTPSFTVNDQKGFYHCFSSGKHGDIFTFLMELEGLSFPEAVERLAQEAGLEMPKRDRQDAARESKRKSLRDITEAAAQWFEAQLTTSAGRAALDYLDNRGVLPETRTQFRVGFAANARQGLKAALAKQGISEADMIAAGLLIKPEDGGQSYDRFRNRIIFPIQDDRGAVIAFGGRAMDPEAHAKYLNSPETELFHKGRVLYNFSAARSPAYEQNALIVVEGYMDVIALHQAGFANVVAPLGTALSEEQLQKIWRVVPEPYVCFDGDKAGIQAAHRLVDRAVPALMPGHSLKFVMLPSGQDPDDLIRAQGAGAFKQVLVQAHNFVDVMWDKEVAAQPISTPEQKAALAARFGDIVRAMRDKSVRRYYGLSLKVRLSDLFWRQERGVRGQKRRGGDVELTQSLPPADEIKIEKTLLGALIEYPETFARLIHEIEGLEFANEVLTQFRDQLIEILHVDEIATIGAFHTHIEEGFYFVLNDVHGVEDENKDLIRGHRFYDNFPIARLQPPQDFIEASLRHIIREIELSALGRHCDEAYQLFEKSMEDDAYQAYLELNKTLESQQTQIRHGGGELLDWASHIRTMFAESEQRRKETAQASGLS